jgi:hypothetical protein
VKSYWQKNGHFIALGVADVLKITFCFKGYKSISYEIFFIKFISIKVILVPLLYG